MQTKNLCESPVLVVGAGIMGVGIAQVAAQAGHSARSGVAEAATAKLSQSAGAG